MEQQRRVQANEAQRRPGLLDGGRASRVEVHARGREDRGDVVPRPARAAPTPSRRSLADHALRRRDEDERLLDDARVDEEVLLPGVLRVVTRVRLVRDQVDELGRGDRKVDVDRDPAAAAAEVVVVGEPRLLAHELGLDVLVRREPEQPRRRGAEAFAERREDVEHRLGGDDLRLSPVRVPRDQVALAGERGVEPLERGGEHRLGRAVRAEAEASLDLVGVAEPLARQPPRERLDAEELVVEPGAPPRIELLALPQLPAQRRRVVREHRRRAKLLGGDAVADLGRAEVRVDEAVDVPTEPQAELDVPQRGLHGGGFYLGSGSGRFLRRGAGIRWSGIRNRKGVAMTESISVEVARPPRRDLLGKALERARCPRPVESGPPRVRDRLRRLRALLRRAAARDGDARGRAGNRSSPSAVTASSSCGPIQLVGAGFSLAAWHPD